MNTKYWYVPLFCLILCCICPHLKGGLNECFILRYLIETKLVMYLFDATNHPLPTSNIWAVHAIDVVKLIQPRLYLFCNRTLYSCLQGTISRIESTKTRHFMDMVSCLVFFMLPWYFLNNVQFQCPATLMFCGSIV